MDSSDNCNDPLNKIAEIPRHPSISAESIESGYESPLPSVYEDAEYALDLKEKVVRALNQYKPITNFDDTKKLLEAFVHHLPLKGQLVLMMEINDHADSPEKLRLLRNFLVDTILKPSMWLSLTLDLNSIC